MNSGTLHMAGHSWPLHPSSLPAMREAAAEPWQVETVAFLDAWWNASDEVAATTSGSTGTPKQIAHRKSDMEASAQRTIDRFDLAAGTRAGLAMPVRFIGGMMMLVRAVVGRWHLTVIEPTSSPEFGAAQDFVALTPPQAKAWWEHAPEEWHACSTLIIGGGRPTTDWMPSGSVGPRVFETFGMTETISHFAVREVHPEVDGQFRCLPGFAVRSLEDGALVVTGPEGQEWVTKDAVTCEGSTAFRWLGRLDDAVNSGGIKIHPETVEEQLAPAVLQPFRCYGEPHARWGQALVLRIHAELEPENASEERERIFHWAKTHLPAHHAPKRIEWRPLTSTWTGKWKRPRAHE